MILDVVMGTSSDGIDAAREIKEISPDTKIIMVTSMAESSYITRAKEAGVESFWYKEVQEQPLLDIMDRTMAGQSVYPNSEMELSSCVSLNHDEKRDPEGVSFSIV
ncbi:MAG: response regulator [Ruminococcus sp.]|nr:response regulator [Ruminococcus sp.]